MDVTRKSVNPLVSATSEVSKTEKTEYKKGKKVHNKQKAINDVIQLNEESEIKLLLELNNYNEQKFQNTDKLINHVSFQNPTFEMF